MFGDKDHPNVSLSQLVWLYEVCAVFVYNDHSAHKSLLHTSAMCCSSVSISFPSLSDFLSVCLPLFRFIWTPMRGKYVFSFNACYPRYYEFGHYCNVRMLKPCQDSSSCQQFVTWAACSELPFSDILHAGLISRFFVLWICMCVSSSCSSVSAFFSFPSSSNSSPVT